VSILLSILISALFLKGISIQNSRLLNQSDIQFLNNTFSGRIYQNDSLLINDVLDEIFKLFENKGVIKIRIFPEIRSIEGDTVVLVLRFSNEKVNPLTNIKFKGIRRTNLAILRRFFSFRNNIFKRDELFEKTNLLQTADILILKGYHFVNLKNGVELVLNFEEVNSDYITGLASFTQGIPVIELEAGSQNFLGWMLQPLLSLYYRQNTLEALDFKFFMLFPLEPHYTIGWRIRYEPGGNEYGVYLKRSVLHYSLWIGGEKYRLWYRVNSGIIFKISPIYTLCNFVINDDKKLSGGGILNISHGGRVYADISALSVYNMERRRVRLETGENYISGSGLSVRIKAGYGVFRIVFYRGIVDVSACGFEIPYKNGIFSLYISPGENLQSFEDYSFSLGFVKRGALFDNIFIFR